MRKTVLRATRALIFLVATNFEVSSRPMAVPGPKGDNCKRLSKIF